MGDTYDQVKKCLNCKKPECTDCFSYNHVTHAEIAEIRAEEIRLGLEGMMPAEISELLGRKIENVKRDFYKSGYIFNYELCRLVKRS